jgi:ATP-dependent RNA helicase MSS116
MGFHKTVTSILQQLPPAHKRQTLLFSATLSESIRKVAAAAMRPGDAMRTVDCVGAGAQDATAALLEQRWLACSQEQLLPTLWAVLRAAREEGAIRKTIVFCPTARFTQFLATVAERGGVPNVLEIHSRKSQSNRGKVSDKFRTAREAVLFTSDVSARGVDYPDVGLVLQVRAANHPLPAWALAQVPLPGAVPPVAFPCPPVPWPGPACLCPCLPLPVRACASG